MNLRRVKRLRSIIRGGNRVFEVREGLVRIISVEISKVKMIKSVLSISSNIGKLREGVEYGEIVCHLWVKLLVISRINIERKRVRVSKVIYGMEDIISMEESINSIIMPWG